MLNGTVGKVVVGKGAVSGNSQDPIHPMKDDRNSIHYIETIWVEDQERDEQKSKEIWRTKLLLVDFWDHDLFEHANI